MAFDLDPFDDILPDDTTKNARIGLKFQPKAKPRRRNESSVSVPSMQLVQTVDVENNVTAGQNADMFFGLESLDNFLAQSPTAIVCTTSRSPSNKNQMVDDLKCENSMSCPVSLETQGCLLASETVTVHASDTRITKEELSIPAISAVDNSTFMEANVDQVHTGPELSMVLDPVTVGECAPSDGNGDFRDGRQLETEFQEVELFPGLDTGDTTSEFSTGQQSIRFQSKSNEQIDKEKSGTGIPNPDAVECISCPQNAHLVPFETESMNEDDVLDLSSLKFGDSVSNDPIPELFVNEELENLRATSQSDAAITGEHLEDVPETPGKVRANSRKIETPILSDRSMGHQNASTSGKENEARRSSKRLRKHINASKLVDESEDDFYNDGDFPSEGPCVDVLEDNDNDCPVENEEKKKRASRKSKKPVTEKERSLRQCKKAKQVPDQSPKEPLKKFPHSTRRNRRRVDKVLLETPEDEIDYKKLKIRDLILLAEHRERTMKKDSTASETQPTNQSAANSFSDDETFAPEDSERYNADETILRVQDSNICFNYHTFMDKTPVVRWTKQDTELFYEAVRQFGTDLSMIQQLFPDRTRKQVKLKYKKEERMHPLRLHEALTNRAKNHTHFELVIDRIKQAAAQDKQNDQDDSIGLTGDEEIEGLTPEINVREGVEKPEQFEEEIKDTGHHLPEVQSPAKSNDSDDDMFGWGEYKSEF